MRSLIRYTAFVGLVAVAGALIAATPARADEAATFKVIVVKATNDGNAMDPKLERYADLLKGRGYTSFTKLHDKDFTLEKGGDKSVSIAGSLKAVLRYISEINGRIAFSCSVFKGSKRQTFIKYSVPRGGKTVVVITGTPGYILIIEAR